MDWLAGNVYWTDALYNWIGIAPTRSDKNIFRVLIDTHLDRPAGIAVYPEKSLLIWSDRGHVPKIEMSSCAGAGRTALVQVSFMIS